MRKFKIILLLLFPVTVWAESSHFVNIVFTPPPTCTEATVLECNTSFSDSSLYAGRNIGQSFQVGSTGTLRKIGLYINSDNLETGESGTLSVRFGTSANLTSYLSSGAVTITDGVVGEVLITMSGAVTLSSGIDYYVAWQFSEPLEDKLTPGYTLTTSCVPNGNTYYDFTDWDMSSAPQGTSDYGITVITCD